MNARLFTAPNVATLMFALLAVTAWLSMFLRAYDTRSWDAAPNGATVGVVAAGLAWGLARRKRAAWKGSVFVSGLISVYAVFAFPRMVRLILMLLQGRGMTLDTEHLGAAAFWWMNVSAGALMWVALAALFAGSTRRAFGLRKENT